LDLFRHRSSHQRGQCKFDFFGIIGKLYAGTSLSSIFSSGSGPGTMIVSIISNCQ